MGTKKIIVKFTDGPSTEFTVGDDWTDEKIKAAVEVSKSGKGKTIAAIDGKTVDGQAASVTPDIDAEKVGKTIGTGLRNGTVWAGEKAADIGSALARGAWGIGKGIVGADESIKAQDDAVLERIKSIKY
jgi:hypothetical protein